MPTVRRLAPADPAELEQALAHALQFDGRKAFKTSGEMMAKITVAHLAGCAWRDRGSWSCESRCWQPTAGARG